MLKKTSIIIEVSADQPVLQSDRCNPLFVAPGMKTSPGVSEPSALLDRNPRQSENKTTGLEQKGNNCDYNFSVQITIVENICPTRNQPNSHSDYST